MLKELHLTNIVLVESTIIHFAPGFNVLSGESGAGKSAIMNALNLIAGDRSDTSVIRRGADKATVEAIFEIQNLPQLSTLLETSGIDHEPDGELFIRRELSTAGKSRAYINNQLAQISLLRQVSEHLFNIIGQHANQKLLSLDYHRLALDLFGEIQSQEKAFELCWNEENSVRQTLESLVNSEAQRMRELEVCRMELEELTEVNVKEGEEEELFEEYTRLSNADELAQKVSDITHIFYGEKNPVLNLLGKQQSTFDDLIALAPSLTEAATSYKNALLELQEVGRTLQYFESRIEHNPQRAAQLNSRLELITKIKRKFGPTLEEIHTYHKNLEVRLAQLENADIEIEELQNKLQNLTQKSNTLAIDLTNARKKASLSFQKEVVGHLRALNMPKVEFHIDITPQKRNKHGDDKIEFFLTPNIGEHRVSLRECASGGELSRTMLALQAVLAGKENTPSLIFDEVDANIGGETASVVGEKLCEIGKQHQILCITHFPQVAKQAEHHIRIFKKEIDGRTVTMVDCLNQETRHVELDRMLGVART